MHNEREETDRRIARRKRFLRDDVKLIVSSQ